MIYLLEQMNFWHWLAIGLVLLLLELLGTAGYLLWLGISAVLVSILVLMLPISWPLQWISFAVFALFTTWLWWRYQHKKDKSDASVTKLNQRGAQMIGQRSVVTKAIVAGAGRLQFGDTTWSVVTEVDLEAGQKVEVVAVEGITLVIKPC
ncbi:NfeD family protein [Photobacterium leiognathi]|uniref:NfeD family protein n=1 Tax=Photobacterium leiognathi TaxID=553611 RepID=A0ABX5GL63_PHOLE|nr:NfeD family protein [Photobacterium leiognathi]KJF91829.1 regulatory protein [Photobacterium leiognathi]PSV86475.1 NfeD family protein [Photobacterium leiognathi]